MTLGEHARPFLTLHVGQAGVQIGHAIWELLCLEHNILLDGTRKPECPSSGFYDAMFVQSASGHFMPRSILVDTDPTCIDEVRVGPYRELFSNNQLLSDYTDTGCSYIRGRKDFNEHLVTNTVDRFRWLMEKTDTVPTVFLIHGVSGGTGSGVAASCLETLVSEFGTSLRVLELNVTSGRSGLQNSCELLNQVLYQYETRDFTSLTFSLTNSAMFNVCRSGLNMTNATYAHVNRMVAMCFSNLTVMERFYGTLHCNVDCITNNVLPFQHLKHPILACAPFSCADTMSKERISPLGVVSAVVEQDSQLADVDLRRGKHMAGVLIFRGAAKPSDVEQAMASLRSKSRMEFVDWAPGGFKTGLIELPPLAIPSSGIASTMLSVTMVSNHTAVATLFRGQSQAIQKLCGGSYFLHNYETGGPTAGHNSANVRDLLKEACDYIDSVAEVYENEKPPDVEVTQPLPPPPPSNRPDVTQARSSQHQRVPDVTQAGGSSQHQRVPDVTQARSSQHQRVSDGTQARSSQHQRVPDVTQAGGSNQHQRVLDAPARQDGETESVTQYQHEEPSSQSTPKVPPQEEAKPQSQQKGGCCKKKEVQPIASEQDTDSLRSSNCSDLEAASHGHRSHGVRKAANRHNQSGESTVSTRSVDSSQELCDIIQSCQPGAALVDNTITSVRRIICKYNQLFASDNPGPNVPPRQ